MLEMDFTTLVTKLMNPFFIEQDIFKEEAALPDDGGALLNQEEEWPSDDSEDDDYDPERREKSCSASEVGTDEDASDNASSSTSLSWSLDGEAFSGSGTWELEGDHYRSQLVDSSTNSAETSDAEIIHSRRQRRAVDYKKLYDVSIKNFAAGQIILFNGNILLYSLFLIV